VSVPSVSEMTSTRTLLAKGVKEFGADPKQQFPGHGQVKLQQLTLVKGFFFDIKRGPHTV
jgi:hypothetical protein